LSAIVPDTAEQSSKLFGGELLAAAVCEQKDRAGTTGGVLEKAKQRGFAGQGTVFAGEISLATIYI
jgi:hypothetical protein